MSYSAVVFNIMLASPSDVPDERKSARDIILDWNNVYSQTRQVVLMPLGWEYNSIPTMGDRPQEIINKQVLNNADILIGIFWTRIGTATGKALSGTVEEIEKHIISGKPALLYFSDKPVAPASIDNQQYDAVVKLKAEFQSNGITSSFNSLEDFKAQFQRHLAMKLNEPQYSADFEKQVEQLTANRSVPILSSVAKDLLIESSMADDGQIMMVRYNGGFDILANGKKLNQDNTPRTEAKWNSALQELRNLGLVDSIGTKGTNFQISDAGYQLADSLAEDSNEARLKDSSAT